MDDARRLPLGGLRVRGLWGKLTETSSPQEDEARREYMTKVVLVLTLLALVLFTIPVVIGVIFGFFDILPAVIMIGMDLIIGWGLWLSHHGRWEISSYMPPVAFYILALFGTYSGGVYTTLILIYVLAILLTAMLRGGWAQWAMLGLSIIGHLFVGFSNTDIPIDDAIPAAITISGSFVGVTLLQRFFAGQYQKALASARAYAAVLQEYRDHLEELIRRRTAALRQSNEELEKEISDRRQAQAALKIAHDELETRVQERTTELTIMLEAARAVSSTLELDTVLSELAKQMVLAIMVTDCQIAKHDQETDTIVIWAEWRRIPSKKTLPISDPIPLSKLPTYQAVLDTREPQILQLSNEQLSANEHEHLRKSAAKSQLILPLSTREQVIGWAILGESIEERQFTAGEIRLCRGLAEQAAVTIENVYLHAETKRRSQRLAALHNIDMAITASLDLKFTLNVLLEQVINQLNVDASCVLLNHNSQILKYAASRGFRTSIIEHTQLRIGDEYAGQAVLTRRPIHVPDIQKLSPSDKRFQTVLTEEDFDSYFVVPLIAKGEVMGVLEIYHGDSLDPDVEWTNFLETLAGQAAIAIHNSERLHNLEVAKTELDVAYSATLEAWVHALELRGGENHDTSHQLVELTLNLARAIDIPQHKLTQIARGALLHDIGNLSIPEEILLKPGPLTEQERKVIEEHPKHGQSLLARIPYLEPAIVIPYCHHERWDGTGYPRGLKGEEIPPEARVFSVVDVWQALTSDRPYRSAWPEEKARDYIRREAGKQFDPMVVEQFFQLDLRW